MRCAAGCGGHLMWFLSPVRSSLWCLTGWPKLGTHLREVCANEEDPRHPRHARDVGDHRPRRGTDGPGQWRRPLLERLDLDRLRLGPGLGGLEPLGQLGLQSRARVWGLASRREARGVVARAAPGSPALWPRPWWCRPSGSCRCARWASVCR